MTSEVEPDLYKSTKDTSSNMSQNYNRPYNQTMFENTTVIVDYTDIYGNMSNSTSTAETVHDKSYSKDIRLITLYLTIILGTIGGMLVLLWMWTRLKARVNSLSRVNSFILNLTVADLLVIGFACLPQLVWEYVDREWIAGEFMCKIVKFLQSFTMMLSTNMLVVIAIDRHQAILKPLKTPIAVWKMVGGAWGVAAFASVPMLYVFKLGYRGGKPLCVSIFSEVPLSHRKAFLTYAAIMVFVIPFIVLMFCYLRIFLKIARKAREARVSQRHSVKPGKVHLQSTPSSSLPKAKIKTLKMTLVIMALFVMCAMPYFIAEMIMSYGDHTIISNSMYGLLGGLAAANSAANPYVFLLFNVQCKGKTDLKRLGSDGTGTVRVYSTNSTRSDFHHESKVFKPHYYKWQNSQNSEVEMQSMIR